MSVLGTVCTGSEFPFRGTCLSQSSQEKVGQHLTFFLSTLISRALFWAQSQGSLASVENCFQEVTIRVWPAFRIRREEKEILKGNY